MRKKARTVTTVNSEWDAPLGTDGKRRPPGLYPDPSGQHTGRWWDGQAWTEHTSATRKRDTGRYVREDVTELGKELGLFAILDVLLRVFK